MKKLLIATIVASICTPVLAAPLGHPSIPPTELHDRTHAGGFYQDVVTHTQPAAPEEPAREEKAVVATTECQPLWGGGKQDDQAAAEQARQDDQDAKQRGVAVVPVPDGCAGLGLARPLYGNMSVGAAVGIGAAIVAVGAAIGNHGGGGHHSSSGTTGTTR
ncbi:hypothetical protein [Pseudomonas sp. AU12215]|uniref:hypothetical protein n=1 Tax=Pseudomonas sp. AU12215 TaxID=1860123 RepID=UPI0007EE2DCB|nr:hypothetical protein [Pseudomonas sp. AU12215]OBY56178.1 hypothetical protein A9513_008660 [Pseudomonas sp. AU12215]